MAFVLLAVRVYIRIRGRSYITSRVYVLFLHQPYPCHTWSQCHTPPLRRNKHTSDFLKILWMFFENAGYCWIFFLVRLRLGLGYFLWCFAVNFLTVIADHGDMIRSLVIKLRTSPHMSHLVTNRNCSPLGALRNLWMAPICSDGWCRYQNRDAWKGNHFHQHEIKERQRKYKDINK